jgi:glyoxylate carboligase
MLLTSKVAVRSDKRFCQQSEGFRKTRSHPDFEDGDETKGAVSRFISVLAKERKLTGDMICRCSWKEKMRSKKKQTKKETAREMNRRDSK